MMFLQNYRRVADVWMDDYAKYMYMRQPHYKNVDPGDLTGIYFEIIINYLKIVFSVFKTAQFCPCQE